MNAALVKDIQSSVPADPANDKTDWRSLIAGASEHPTLSVLLQTRKGPQDAVRRAATMVHALRDKSLTVHDEGVTLPLRWGVLACNGLATFTRLLHVSMATLKTREVAELLRGDDLHAARQAAGQPFEGHWGPACWIRGAGKAIHLPHFSHTVQCGTSREIFRKNQSLTERWRGSN